MKKSSKNQILLLIGLLGAAIAVLVYFFVYNPNIEKAEAMEAENIALAGEVARLETLYNQLPSYIAETERLQSGNREFESMFPADIRYEDSIMMVKTMEDSTRTQVGSIAFGGVMAVPYLSDTGGSVQNPAAAVADAAAGSQSEQALAAADTELGGTSPVINNSAQDVIIYDTTLYQVPLNLSIECTYDDFKGLITYIYNQPERMSVEGVSLSYNHENGELSGSMSLNTYYLLGTDKLYTEPCIPNMRMGVETIFGDTIESSGGNSEEAE